MDERKTVIVHFQLVRNPRVAGKGWVYDLDADQFLRALNPTFSLGAMVKGDFELEEGKRYLVCACESSHKHSRYSYSLVKVENGEVVTLAEWEKRDRNYSIPEKLKELWLEYRRLQRRGEQVGEGNIGFAKFLLRKLEPEEPTTVVPEAEAEEQPATPQQAQIAQLVEQALKPTELEIELEEQPAVQAAPPAPTAAGLVRLYLLSMRLPSKYLMQSVEHEATEGGLREVRKWEGEKRQLASRLETIRWTAYNSMSRVFAYVEDFGVWIAVTDEAKDEAEKVSKFVKEELVKLGLPQYAERYVVRAVPVYLEPEEAERVLSAAIEHLSADVEELREKIEKAKREENKRALARLERDVRYKEALLQAFKNYLSSVVKR